MMKWLFLLAITATSVANFGSAFVPALMRGQTATTVALHLLSPSENKVLLDQAESCLEECSLEQVDELIQTLHAQQTELSKRLGEVQKMIVALEMVNGKNDRPVDQVRETVRAIYRIFQLGDKASGNDYPSLRKPTGYAGEVGKGKSTKTAYDVLNPKKWTP